MNEHVNLEYDEWIASMVSLRSRHTGLDNTVFVSAKFPGHRPRVKVAVDPPTHIDHHGRSASVAIDTGELLAGESLPPKVLARVREWLDINRDALLDYWEERIDTAELLERLRKL